MASILNGIVFVVGLGLIPYAIPLITPTWRWLLGVALVIGGALCAIWARHWIVTASPEYKGGAGDALGLAFFAVVSTSFIVGVSVRAFTMLLAARRLPLRHVFTIGVVGFAFVPAAFVVPSAWQAWKMRAPSDACANALFDIVIAKAALRIPAAPVFSVYTNKNVSRDAYYFWFNPRMRSFCSLTANGREAVKATHISISLQHADLRDKCGNVTLNWTKTYCVAFAPGKRIGIDDIDFAIRADIFAANEVIMGEFSGSLSTYEESLSAAAKPDKRVFFTTEKYSPDGKPLTLTCDQIPSGYWCKVAYPWRDGVHLTYTFRSKREDVLARSARIDTNIREFINGLSVN